MYMNLSKMECNCNPEGKGFLACVDLGKDEAGKRIRPKARGKSEDEAVAKLEKKLREMGYVQPETNAPKLDMIINQFTLIPDFVREYKVNIIKQRVEDEDDLSSRTGENYIYNLKQFETFFQNVTVGEITTSALNQFFKAMALKKNSRNEYAYSQVTLDRIKFIVRSMFKRAYKKGWTSCDPFDSEEYKKPVSKKTMEKVEGLDPSELKQVLMLVKECPVIYAPISLMLNTGIRTQEVLALKWGNISFETNTIQIEQAVTIHVQLDDDANIESRSSVVDEPKTEGSKRLIGLTPEAKKIIADWREIAPIISKTKFADNDFIFGYERKSNFTYNAFRGKVNSYLTRQSGDVDKMRLHRLRHTVGTLLAAEGREVLQIMRQLGITQEKTLQRYIDKKGNKKIMDGNVQAISKGLSGMFAQESTSTENPVLQAILQEAEGVTDDKAKAKAKALISCLLGMVQGV